MGVSFFSESLSPSFFDRITLPAGCEVIALVAVGLDPPDLSERVNVYLPKSLLKRVDRLAKELGMSRSSFFGFAVTNAIAMAERYPEAWAEAGRLRLIRR